MAPTAVEAAWAAFKRECGVGASSLPLAERMTWSVDYGETHAKVAVETLADVADVHLSSLSAALAKRRSVRAVTRAFAATGGDATSAAARMAFAINFVSDDNNGNTSTAVVAEALDVSRRTLDGHRNNTFKTTTRGRTPILSPTGKEMLNTIVKLRGDTNSPVLVSELPVVRRISIVLTMRECTMVARA
jgi:hypothetical protein